MMDRRAWLTVAASSALAACATSKDLAPGAARAPVCLDHEEAVIVWGQLVALADNLNKALEPALRTRKLSAEDVQAFRHLWDRWQNTRQEMAAKINRPGFAPPWSRMARDLNTMAGMLARVAV